MNLKNGCAITAHEFLIHTEVTLCLICLKMLTLKKLEQAYALLADEHKQIAHVYDPSWAQPTISMYWNRSLTLEEQDVIKSDEMKYAIFHPEFEDDCSIMADEQRDDDIISEERMIDFSEYLKPRATSDSDDPNHNILKQLLMDVHSIGTTPETPFQHEEKTYKWKREITTCEYKALQNHELLKIVSKELYGYSLVITELQAICEGPGPLYYTANFYVVDKQDVAIGLTPNFVARARDELDGFWALAADEVSGDLYSKSANWVDETHHEGLPEPEDEPKNVMDITRGFCR